MEKIRLSKLMSERGLCSRRQADAWIENQQVRVDGEIVAKLGVRVDPECSITLEPAALDQQRNLVTVLLNKPVGYVSGQPEKSYPTASTLITRSNQYRSDPSGIRYQTAHRRNLAPAGRLDIDSRGLLVLTQDGRIARQLIAPDSVMEKEYRVRVDGHVDSGTVERLRYGLRLDGRQLKPAGIEKITHDQLQMTLIEGRKRQIRRMCELVGLTVARLERVRIGNVRLGDLPVGQWRYLGKDESF